VLKPWVLNITSITRMKTGPFPSAGTTNTANPKQSIKSSLHTKIKNKYWLRNKLWHSYSPSDIGENIQTYPFNYHVWNGNLFLAPILRWLGAPLPAELCQTIPNQNLCLPRLPTTECSFYLPALVSLPKERGEGRGGSRGTELRDKVLRLGWRAGGEGGVLMVGCRMPTFQQRPWASHNTAWLSMKLICWRCCAPILARTWAILTSGFCGFPQSLRWQQYGML
jgi:hypothetical protein